MQMIFVFILSVYFLQDQIFTCKLMIFVFIKSLHANYLCFYQPPCLTLDYEKVYDSDEEEIDDDGAQLSKVKRKIYLWLHFVLDTYMCPVYFFRNVKSSKKGLRNYIIPIIPLLMYLRISSTNTKHDWSRSANEVNPSPYY